MIRCFPKTKILSEEVVNLSVKPGIVVEELEAGVVVVAVVVVVVAVVVVVVVVALKEKQKEALVKFQMKKQKNFSVISSRLDPCENSCEFS